MGDEEETVQPKPLAAQITPLVQRQVEPEEEEEEDTLQAKPLAAQVTPLVQRQEAEGEEEEEEEEPIQAKPARGSTPHIGPGLAAQIRSLKGGGRPLSQAERGFFEPRFGYDFSRVRIHSNGKAAELSRSLKARAFTHGRDIVLSEQQDPSGSRTGMALLAHELSHVVQQGASVSQSPETATTFKRGAGAPNIAVMARAPSIQRQIRKVTRRRPDPARVGRGRLRVVAAISRWSHPLLNKAYHKRPGSFISANGKWPGARAQPDIYRAWKLHKTTGSKRTIGNAPWWMGDTVKRVIGDGSIARGERLTGRNFEHFPSTEYWVPAKTPQNTCNIFVFDVLYKTGHAIIRPDGRYPMPAHICDGKVTQLNEIRDPGDILPGDIFANAVHTGIVSSHHKNGWFHPTELRHKNGKFDAIETYGVGVRPHEWPTTGYRFFEVL